MKKFIGFFILLCLLFPQSFRAESFNLEDGNYEVDVALWHAYEDKLSMGSNGIAKTAELLKEGDKVTLYLSMQPISAFNLTCSVERFYILDKVEKSYIRGQPMSFDLLIKPEEKARPSLILLPLREKATLYPVLVDPEVSLMGTDPIKARLYVDWSSIRPLSDEGVLIKKAKVASNEMINPWVDYQMEEVKLFHAPKNGAFKIENISKKALEAKGLKLGALDKVKGYSLSLNEPLMSIPEDKTINTTKLSKPMTLEKKTRLLFLKTDYDKVFQLDNGQFKVLDSKKSAEGIEVMVDRLGDFALLKGQEKPLTPFVTVEDKKVGLPNVQSLQKKSRVPTKIAKIKQIERKRVQEKALALKSAEDGNKDKGILQKAEPKERYGIIALVLFFYIFLASIGLYLCRRAYVILKVELERRYFIQSEKFRGGVR